MKEVNPIQPPREVEEPSVGLPYYTHIEYTTILVGSLSLSVLSVSSLGPSLHVFGVEFLDPPSDMRTT